MRWRLVEIRTTGRWLEIETLDPETLEGFGLELPDGARIHSIHPAAYRDTPGETTKTIGHAAFDVATTDRAVTEWAVFVAMPITEEPA